MGFSVGILGKHPGYGDFIRHGLSDATAQDFEKWLNTTLHSLRQQMGDAWPDFWDRAISLRFWVGRGVMGKTLAGVLVPSHDKVGRRYPFVLMAEAVGIASPVADQDQAFYEFLEQHLQRMQHGQGGAALLEGIGLETLPAGQEAAEDLAQGPLIWAHQPSGDLGALLRAAGPVDQARAATSRSYWWAPPRANGMPAMWLGHTGLPDAHALGWLLSGNLGQQSPQADRGVMHAPQ